MSDWDESKHPRAKDGKFGEGGGNEELSATMGEIASHPAVVQARNVAKNYPDIKSSDNPKMGPRGETLDEMERMAKDSTKEAIERDDYRGHNAASQVHTALANYLHSAPGKAYNELGRLHSKQAQRHYDRAQELKKNMSRDDDSVTLSGVEMFAEGTWNGNPFTSDDVDSIVDSFKTLALGGRVPLKLGHEGKDARDMKDREKNPLAQLALGWVINVYRAGKKLLADWEVPPEVASMIKKGYLRHVSVELLKDVQAGTRVIPWVLDAVALLGSDQPAVGILKDLRKALGMARDAVELPHAARLAFSAAGEDQSINFGESNDMSDSVAIKELADKIATMQVQINTLGEQNASLKTENTGLKAVKSQFTALELQVQKDKRDAHRRAITDRLEAAVKSEDIQPKVRANFVSVYGVEDDDQVMKVTIEQVDDFIKGNPNPFKKKVLGSKVVSLSRASDEVPAGTSVDDEVRMRVEASLREDKINDPTDMDIQRATVRLFRANPDLATRHRASVNAAIAHPSATRQ